MVLGWIKSEVRMQQDGDLDPMFLAAASVATPTVISILKPPLLSHRSPGALGDSI